MSIWKDRTIIADYTMGQTGTFPFQAEHLRAEAPRGEHRCPLREDLDLFRDSLMRVLVWGPQGAAMGIVACRVHFN
jgi:hypothetical protein